jgi:hypothetical protein
MEIIGNLFCNLEVPGSVVMNFLIIFSQLFYTIPFLVLIYCHKNLQRYMFPVRGTDYDSVDKEVHIFLKPSSFIAKNSCSPRHVFP